MMGRPDHIRCALTGRHDRPDDHPLGPHAERKTWCGRDVPAAEWCFTDAGHAALNASAGGRLTCCPACASAISSAVLGGDVMSEPIDHRRCPTCGHPLHVQGQCRHGWSLFDTGLEIGWREDVGGEGCECGQAEVYADLEQQLARAHARGVAKERARCLALAAEVRASSEGDTPGRKIDVLTHAIKAGAAHYEDPPREDEMR